MNPYALAAAAIGGVVLAVVLALGGYKAGAAVVQSKWNEAELNRAEMIVVRIQKERVVEQKVITKYRDRVQTITVNAEEVKNEIPTIVRADCVVPADLLLQLHAISRGTTVKNTGVTEAEAAGASCRSLAGAIKDAYAAHFAVVAQVNAILDFDEGLATTP